ncbi:hypothetical protein YerA41_108 [Yersinia phage YerA41]|nr:hypothetical protein YerA41_108 [Yersinia phage YerA41]
MSESGVDKGRDLVNSIKSQKLETKDQSLDMNDLVVLLIRSHLVMKLLVNSEISF